MYLEMSNKKIEFIPFQVFSKNTLIAGELQVLRNIKICMNIKRENGFE